MFRNKMKSLIWKLDNDIFLPLSLAHTHTHTLSLSLSLSLSLTHKHTNSAALEHPGEGRKR